MSFASTIESRGRSTGLTTRASSAIVLLAVTVCVMSACGSAGVPAAQACQRIAEVLDESPVQSADPSGFALFQVRPLSAIRTSDATLQHAIDLLLPADRVIASSSASAPAAAAATRTAARQDAVINGQCPGLGI